jgi:two-component system, OmpR family, response regulator
MERACFRHGSRAGLNCEKYHSGELQGVAYCIHDDRGRDAVHREKSTMMERRDQLDDDPSRPSESGRAEFTRAAHVLAVDDDQAMRAMIADYLADQNVRVSVAADSRDMQRVLAAGGVDLVILDLKLGNEDGLEIVRALRAESDLPIIVLTGHRRESVDRVVGLELGADDYLTKPFSPRELLARIHAVLRRRSPAARPDKDAKRTRYRFAGWELNLHTRRLSSPSGQNVPLTKGEFALLAVFLQSPQRVLTREHLLSASRVHDNEVFDRSIDVQILRLRRKLESDPSAPSLIKTERGVGYVFASPVEVR